MDDPLNPTAGFVVSPEAAYLSGDAGNDNLCTSLETFLRDANHLGLPMWHLIMVVSSARWTQRLSEMAGQNGIVRYVRWHYLWNCEGDLGSLPPPSGAALKRADEDFLAGYEEYRICEPSGNSAGPIA